MALVINSNVSSINAQRNLSRTSLTLEKSLQRLSSGLRINSAKDDAAGLAISDRFTSAIRGLNQAARNANDGISLAQTAEGALSESTNLLQRVRELAIQSANDTNSAQDRLSIQDEVEQVKSELNRIANTTEFNGRKLLDGSASNMSFQVGIRASQTISFSITGAAATDLGNNSVSQVNATVNFGTGGVAAANATLPAANVIAAQTLTISGSAGSDTVAVGAGNSAATIATAINAKQASTGVTATATNTATLAALGSDGTVTLTLGSGNDTAVLSATVQTGDLSNLADEINNKSGTTNITATASGGTLTLTQADGNDINIEGFTNSGATKTITVQGADGAAAQTLTGGAADSTVVAGTVTLNSSESFTASSSIAAAAGSIFNVAADTVVGSTESLVSAIDISSQQGANDALVVVDAAIASIDQIRAGLGSIQNRFQSTISNLQNVSENVTAARSRILDADFAAETSSLTKSQILQQAGVSVLSQANQVQQSILTLLQ